MTKQKATLVLVNPVGNDADCWQFLGPIDGQPFLYPGHGGRRREPGWTHQQMADEVVAKFEGPLDLVGMSVGGLIVSHILARHPERVRSAVIACCYLARGAGSAEAIEAYRRTQKERGQIALRGGMAAAVEATLPRWFTPLAIRTEVPGVAYARRTLLAMDPEAWNDIWVGSANSEPITLDAMANIKQPVTLLAATHDSAAGLGLAQAHKYLRNSRLEIVAGPHMLHLEEPLALLSALERHFAWAPIGNRVEQPLGTLVA